MPTTLSNCSHEIKFMTFGRCLAALPYPRAANGSHREGEAEETLLPLREIIGKLNPTLRATMSQSKVQSRLPRSGQVGPTLRTKRGGITYELLH
jgi:hypothetical protein